MKLKFDFTTLSFDGEVPDCFNNHSYLHFVGDFSILINGRMLYNEAEFCLVEFAAYATHWLRNAQRNPQDFVYASVESVDRGVVWIKRKNSQWQIGSIHQEYDEKTLFTLNEISVTFGSFKDSLRDEIWQVFNVDMDELVEEFINSLLF